MGKYMTLKEEIARIKEVTNNSMFIEQGTFRKEPRDWKQQGQEIISDEIGSEPLIDDDYIYEWVSENYSEESLNSRNFTEVVSSILNSYGVLNAPASKVISSPLKSMTRDEVGSWIKENFEGRLTFTTSWVDIADTVINFITDIIQKKEYENEPEPTDVDNEPYAPDDEDNQATINL